MRIFFLLIFLFGLFGCTQPDDSLDKTLKNVKLKEIEVNCLTDLQTQTKESEAIVLLCKYYKIKREHCVFLMGYYIEKLGYECTIQKMYDNWNHKKEDK